MKCFDTTAKILLIIFNGIFVVSISDLITCIYSTVTTKPTAMLYYMYIYIVVLFILLSQFSNSCGGCGLLVERLSNVFLF